jgi:hypothetical protein
MLYKIWPDEQAELLTKYVFHYTKKGFPMEDAFIKVSKKLSKDFEVVKGFWYDHLYPKHKEEIKAIRKRVGRYNSYEGIWNKDHEKMVIKCVLYCIRKNKKIGDAFFMASKRTGRSRKSCANRWYQKLSKKDIIKDMVKRAQEGIREEV